MKIEVDEVIALRKQLALINREELKDIELYDNGRRIKIDDRLAYEQEKIELNNIDFIAYKYWKTNSKKAEF